MSDRDEFEKWWLAKFSGHKLARAQSLGGDLTSVYIDSRANVAWQAWQAARAQGEGVPVVWINKETLQKLVEDPKQRLQQVWINPKRTDEDDTPLYTHPAPSVPEMTSAIINDCAWTFIEAMPHNLPGPIWNDLKPALYAAIKEYHEKVLTTTPQPADKWIKCSERLPTEADGDQFGKVWVHDRAMTRPEFALHLADWQVVGAIDDYTHWISTGLKRPAPPEQESE